MNTETIRRALKNALPWAILLALTAMLLLRAASVSALAPFSLRFSTEISGKAAYAARQYAVENAGDTTAFWPTFWRETRAVFAGEYKSVTASAIIYSGDAALVCPAEYLSGSAPGVTDGAGCALSSALAWALWGSTDVLGKTVEIDGEPRIVRGVFESTRELALISVRDEDQGESFSACELTGGDRHSTRADAKSWALAAGLGTPEYALSGRGFVFAAYLLAALPIMILLAHALISALSFVKKPPVRAALACALFALILALPTLLDALPAWVIPSRWSDFSFWSALAGGLQGALRDALSPGAIRDVELRLAFIAQAGISLAAACAAVAICVRKGNLREKKESKNG